MRDNSQCLTTCISCSIFERELECCRRQFWPDMKVVIVSSVLHMRPDRLAVQLHSLVSKERREGRRVVLAYGDCCWAMSSLENLGGVARTSGANCCEILLGRATYRRLSHEGAFFISPEWALRWREVFGTELGLEPALARMFMQDLHRKMVYVDTGVVPEPAEAIRDCAAYCGLPLERLQVPLDRLRASIEDALSRLTPAGVHA